MGMNKTADRVRRYAVWYKMIESCLIYVKRELSSVHPPEEAS